MPNPAIEAIDLLFSVDGLTKLRKDRPDITLAEIAKRETPKILRCPLYGYIENISECIEPFDPAMPSEQQLDPQRRASRAFRKGGFMAVGLTVALVPTRMLRELGADYELYLEEPETEDDLSEVSFNNADLILNEGGLGFAAADVYREMFEAEENALCPNVSVQNYFKGGFGFAFKMIAATRDQLVYQDDVNRFAEELDGTTIDWDTAAAELFNT